MKNNSKKQKAGNNSIQYQVENINFGISEERVRNIIDREKEIILKESSIIAEQKALERLNSFEEVLVPKLVEDEIAKNFERPEIQVLFRETEKTAICTDRKKDYELLSELLVHRIKREGNYTTCAAITKAIKDVDIISEDALRGLTIVFAITTYVPISSDIEQGLKVLDNLYGKIIEGDTISLNDISWIDNLEIINAVKTKSYTKNKKLEDFFYESFNGYSSLGIKKESDDYNLAIDELRKKGIPSDLLVSNTLNEEYVRVPCINLNDFDGIKLTAIMNDKIMIIDLAEKQKEVLRKIVDSYYDKKSIKNEFVCKLKQYKHINEVIEWWNTNMIEHSFDITPIGRVIAHTNAKSIDSSLPDLD